MSDDVEVIVDNRPAVFERPKNVVLLQFIKTLPDRKIAWNPCAVKCATTPLRASFPIYFFTTSFSDNI